MLSVNVDKEFDNVFCQAFKSSLCNKLEDFCSLFIDNVSSVARFLNVICFSGVEWSEKLKQKIWTLHVLLLINIMTD